MKLASKFSGTDAAAATGEKSSHGVAALEIMMEKRYTRERVCLGHSERGIAEVLSRGPAPNSDG